MRKRLVAQSSLVKSIGFTISSGYLMRISRSEMIVAGQVYKFCTWIAVQQFNYLWGNHPKNRATNNVPLVNGVILGSF